MKWLKEALRETWLESRTSDGRFAIVTMLVVFGGISLMAWHPLPIMVGFPFIPVLVWLVFQLKEIMCEMGLKNVKGGKEMGNRSNG